MFLLIIDKIVIYNSEILFFNHLEFVNQVIKSQIKIYSDNNSITFYPT